MCVITVRSLSPTAPPSRPRSHPPGQGKGPSQAQLLMAMAEDTYRLIRSTDGRAYAVPKTGPADRRAARLPVRKQHPGPAGRLPAPADRQGRLRLRAVRLHHRAEGEASELDPRPVWLRVGQHDGTVVVDMGTETGQCITITPRGWAVEADSPVIFRRSELTHPLVQPQRGGTLDALRGPDQPARGGLPAGHRLGGGRLPDRHPAPHPAGPG